MLPRLNRLPCSTMKKRRILIVTFLLNLPDMMPNLLPLLSLIVALPVVLLMIPSAKSVSKLWICVFIWYMTGFKANFSCTGKKAV